MHALGVDLYLYQQGIDTTTPTNRSRVNIKLLIEFHHPVMRSEASSCFLR